MGALEPFRGERNRQFTGDEVFFHDNLCRASLPQEQIDAAVTSMKSTEVWSMRTSEKEQVLKSNVPRKTTDSNEEDRLLT